MTAIVLAACALAGFVFWGWLEYAIHGWLAHRFRTFASPLHWGHHREPAAVFTSPLAVVPATVLLIGLLWLALGLAPGAAWLAGTLVGFVRYERLHWRYHFRAPRNERERRARSHHLAHHFRNPRAYFGVTTRLWDRLFGSLPDSREADYARVRDWPPLEGRSNLVEIWSPRSARVALRRG